MFMTLCTFYIVVFSIYLSLWLMWLSLYSVLNLVLRAECYKVKKKKILEMWFINIIYVFFVSSQVQSLKLKIMLYIFYNKVLATTAASFLP